MSMPYRSEYNFVSNSDVSFCNAYGLAGPSPLPTTDDDPE